MAAEGMPFPWRWNDGTISTNLGVIWEMSAKIKSSDGRGIIQLPSGAPFWYYFLGITSIEELPEFEKVQSDLQTFMDSKDNEDNMENESFAENTTQQ